MMSLTAGVSGAVILTSRTIAASALAHEIDPKFKEILLDADLDPHVLAAMRFNVCELERIAADLGGTIPRMRFVGLRLAITAGIFAIPQKFVKTGPLADYIWASYLRCCCRIRTLAETQDTSRLAWAERVIFPR